MDQSSPKNPDADFGRYLASVVERDIDLLLMEEFHVSDDFVAWFCSKLGLHGITPAGAWHSLSDTDGESGLLLRVLQGERRIGVLIENKVGAPEQDLQAERYHLRGIKSREQGKLDDYVTVMCAPQRYLDALSPTSAYQHRVSYELIAAWFNTQQSRRTTAANGREGFLHRIRHYGLFANANRADNIATARAFLDVAPPAADPQQQSDIAPDAPPLLPCPCPRCGARMIVIEVFACGCEPEWRPTPSTIDTS
jgi:PD-(D/E)XK nuclease superfamily